ncbi:unnamed protein product, partial [Amoebophrya sp. A120]|eukprot:GSA120T00002781001.1
MEKYVAALEEVLPTMSTSALSTVFFYHAKCSVLDRKAFLECCTWLYHRIPLATETVRQELLLSFALYKRAFESTTAGAMSSSASTTVGVRIPMAARPYQQENNCVH